MVDFKELVTDAETDPSCVDFSTLRTVYQGYENRTIKHITRQKLIEMTNHVTEFKEVATVCQSILDTNPMDLEARMMIASAYEHMGEKDTAEKHHQFAERMIDAILATGTGKSFEGAWKLVSENEAWTIMRIFGMRAQKHHRHVQDNLIFDVYDGVIGDREATMYFDVTEPVHFVDEHVIGDSSV